MILPLLYEGKWPKLARFKFASAGDESSCIVEALISRPLPLLRCAGRLCAVNASQVHAFLRLHPNIENVNFHPARQVDDGVIISDRLRQPDTPELAFVHPARFLEYRLADEHLFTKFSFPFLEKAELSGRSPMRSLDPLLCTSLALTCLSFGNGCVANWIPTVPCPSVITLACMVDESDEPVTAKSLAALLKMFPSVKSLAIHPTELHLFPHSILPEFLVEVATTCGSRMLFQLEDFSFFSEIEDNNMDVDTVLLLLRAMPNLSSLFGLADENAQEVASEWLDQVGRVCTIE